MDINSDDDDELLAISNDDFRINPAALKRLRAKTYANTEEERRKQARKMMAARNPRLFRPIKKLMSQLIVFMRELPAPGFDVKNPLRYKPDLEQLKEFIRSVCDNTTGILDENGKPVLTTIEEKMRQTFSALEDYGGHRFEKVERMLLIKYIREELGPFLSDLTRGKSVADAESIRDLLSYLWRFDEHAFKHPQTRLNLALLILIEHYHGTRPGELVESSAHPGSGEGLT
ncbi:hypothetical protein LTR95_017122 [Oleoguttula sp. CCFEE 5521]